MALQPVFPRKTFNVLVNGRFLFLSFLKYFCGWISLFLKKWWDWGILNWKLIFQLQKISNQFLGTTSVTDIRAYLYIGCKVSFQDVFLTNDKSPSVRISSDLLLVKKQETKPSVAIEKVLPLIRRLLQLGIIFAVCMASLRFIGLGETKF